ncbi:hypothetical protein V8G54_023580 [Vigna mungo]|uniref:Uncharacterized protein n=1 Tax=Vigna mungo TaxID=3915 RepID=A0AAQ3N4E8_VIGMU
MRLHWYYLWNWVWDVVGIEWIRCRPSTPPTNTLAQPSFFGIGGNLNSSGSFGVQSNPHSTPVDLTIFPGSTRQTPATFNNSGFQKTSDVLLSNKLQPENVTGDVSIWLKDKWNPGEIPEEAPPDSLVR